PRYLYTLSLHDALPILRLRFGTKADLKDATTTDWADVTEATDFIHHFALSGLKADTTYHYESETSGADGKPHGIFRGQFRTAPRSEEHTSELQSRGHLV